MKPIFNGMSLVAVLLISCTLSAAVAYWYAGKKFGEAFLLVQDIAFTSQGQALKQLKAGSNSEAIEYLRAMNELGIVKTAQSTHEKRALPGMGVDLPTIKYACSDYEQHPASWFSTDQARRNEIRQACQILLSQSERKHVE